jgi:hypothetical protein
MPKIAPQMTKFLVQSGFNDHTIISEMLADGNCEGAILNPDYSKAFATLPSEILTANKSLLYNPASVSDENVSLESMLDTQARLKVSIYVLPAFHVRADNVSGLGEIHDFIAQGKSHIGLLKHNAHLMASLILQPDVIANATIRQSILNAVTGNEAHGFYIIVDQSTAQGSLCEPGLLSGLCELVFGLVRNKYRVIFGYSSYEALVLFPFGLAGFAAGGFSNTRVYSSQKVDEFRQAPKQRLSSLASLSHMKVADELDKLYGSTVLNELNDGSPYASALFQQQRPADVVWSRKDSFKHYLYSCGLLSTLYAGKGYSDRLTTSRELLDNARKFWTRARSKTSFPNALSSHIEVWSTELEKAVQSIGKSVQNLMV